MLTDKIKHINPDIIIEENGIPTVIVPVSEYRNTALFFKNDPQLSFDYLVCMTGMDWGDSMGVINLLESTIHGHRIFLKTSTTDRENPELPSISDIWETANLNEREVFDFFGIRFINHPDMRRLFLRNDWVGYPLRKDYDASEVINPVRIESDETLDTAPTYKENRSGEIQEKENIVFI